MKTQLIHLFGFFAVLCLAVVAPANDYQIETILDSKKFEDVQLAKSRTVTIGDKKYELKRVTHGLRKKALFGMIPVRVYVMELFVADPSKLDKSPMNFLYSLKKAGPVQIRLTFLVDVAGEKMAAAFRDGLEANGISLTRLPPELTALMKDVTEMKKFKNGETLGFTGVWNDGKSNLVFDDVKNPRTIEGGEVFMQHVFSIWFGRTSDAKLADLKEQMMDNLD